jgi:prephenate dehydratase
MEPVVVAFQGEAGAYSEAAGLEYFHSAARTVACHTFEDVFAAVSAGQVNNGILPIENSLAGSIHRNYDLLLRNELFIVGEYHHRVNHCLLALPGVKLEGLEQVHSHPQALAQCETSLARLKLPGIAEADTAGSAKWLSESRNRKAGAIASRRAAQVYGLNILVENLEDNPANYTRFLIIAAKPLEVAPSSAENFKTSIVFSMPNRPGILYKAMSVFALRDIDLTKIESRPIAGKPWEYMFYIDFAGYNQSPVCARALAHLEELTIFLRILGSYPRHQISY